MRRIGRGGMGEVFQAVRLGAGGFRKDVALKRLALDQSIEGRAVQRFLQEARITARLDHPHLVRVYDLLDEGGVHFMVMELLRGLNVLELVRALRPAGPIPWPPLLEVARQALEGLAHAHALRGDDGTPLGLVHRDLTPRNLFVCEDGVVKVLDFGIARLRQGPGAFTTTGSLAGTFEFLSPEQARAEPLDGRSDLYQLAASLYFCLTGRSPHGTGGPLELLREAMHGTPPPLRTLRPDVPPEVEAVVMKALAHAPEQRFADALAMRDAVAALLRDETPALAELVARARPREDVAPRLDDAPSDEGPPTRPLAPRDEASPTQPMRARPRGAIAPPATTPSRRGVLLALGGAALAGAGVLVGAQLPRAAQTALPRWQRRSFRRGTVHGAAFSPDGRGLVVSATWGEDAPNVWLSSPDSPETRSLDVPGQELLAVGPNGALALLDDAQPLYGFARRGTLMRAALAGGAPRAELEAVQSADFAPDGSLLVLRWLDETARVEWPAGKVLAETSSGWFSEPRISPDGRHVAWLFHPGRYDDRGRLVVVDRGGRQVLESEEFLTAKGVAWRDTRTVWLTASRDDNTRALWAAPLDGPPRLLSRAPASLTLFDVDELGRALVTRDSFDITVSFAQDGVSGRDLSWFDASFAMGLSDDGRVALLNEGGGDAVAGDYGAYLRPTDGGPAVRLSSGHAAALSPDGAHALVIASTWDRLLLVPAGAGTTTELLARPGLQAASFSPDGTRVLVAASGARAQELFELPVSGGAAVERTVAGHAWRAPSCPLSPDGASLVLTELASDRLRLFSRGGTARELPGVQPGEALVRFSSDGRALFVTRFDELPAPVVRVDLETQERRLLYRLAPTDTTGVSRIFPLALSADARAAAYTWRRTLSVLYLLSDLEPR
ncbi:MAG: protein kinase domain-containing protein [Myxococcota bacterium]